jgi:hypothetical protein
VVASPLPPKPNDIPGMLHVLSPFDDGDERYHRPTVVLFTEVRGIKISANFALTQFHEVRAQK